MAQGVREVTMAGTSSWDAASAVHSENARLAKETMKLGHGGRGPPEAHRLMRRFLPVFAGTNVGISHLDITGYVRL